MFSLLLIKNISEQNPEGDMIKGTKTLAHFSFLDAVLSLPVTQRDLSDYGIYELFPWICAKPWTLNVFFTMPLQLVSIPGWKYRDIDMHLIKEDPEQFIDANWKEELLMRTGSLLQSISIIYLYKKNQFQLIKSIFVHSTFQKTIF